jgi:agmatinase
MPHTLDTRSNFLALPKEYSGYDTSKIVVVPVPYEYTVSYGSGTKYGPKAILNASHYVEFYDEEFDRELCFDVGIATLRALSFGDKKKKVDREAISLIESKVEELLEDGKFVAVLGGEHTISSGPISAFHKKYPDLSVLQFDAHSDLRDEYEGNKYSHASVMARVGEFLDPAHIVQVGIRAQAKDEAIYIKEHNVHTFYVFEIRQGKYTRVLKYWQDQVIDNLSDNVYITFDVDYFDPSLMPATGTPEPNGMNWHETMSLLQRLGRKKNIVGFDVVELAPMKGLNHPDITAAKLVYKIMNYAFLNK